MVFTLIVTAVALTIGLSAFVPLLATAQPSAAVIEQEGAGNTTSTTNATSSLPQVKDQKLKVEPVTSGLNLSTSMVFIDRSNLMVTQKGGSVILVSFQNSTAPPSKTAIMKFNVTTSGERGLLGVTAINNIRSNDTTGHANDTFVFFYLTEAGADKEALGNRVYRYEFDNMTKSLSNGTLLLDLPAEPGPRHNGGKIISSAEDDSNYLYLVIGDLDRRNGTLQNYGNATTGADDTSVIIRINSDGTTPRENPFAEIAASEANITVYQNLSKYYAYGIRNSFGLAIDPVTSILWDTENGPAGYDEINIVQPGFNSGWAKVIGPIERRNVTEQDLVRFQNSSYADPVFSWRDTVAVTDIEFVQSELLGKNYTNNIFVGDFNNGSLYYFEVNENRTGLKFQHPGLNDDLVASNEKQVQEVLFGTGFAGGITDIATGPDGYLYVLTYGGTIYRVGPK